MIQPGHLLRNRYEIRKLIGRGGMADVYLAFDRRRMVQVAIKVMREDLAEDPEFLQRFTREARALAQLDHPHIVRFYSFERDGGLAFIVMDYVEGETLRKHLLEAGGPLPWEEVTRILRQVGSALQYAHNQGYIHRDIKPGNILIRKDGTALLSDFGIARVAETATMTMGAVGAPAYMSPEQIRGDELTPRSDIYSLGIVLYEMVSGRRPFTGESDSSSGSYSRLRRIQQQQLHEAPPDPRQFNPELSQGAAWVIEKALAKAPADRWPDVMSMVRAWEDAMGVQHQQMAEGRPVTPISPTLPEPHADSRSRRSLAVAIAVGVVIVALVLLFMAQKALFPVVESSEQAVTPSPTVVAQNPTQAPTLTEAPTPDIQATAQAMAAQMATSTAEAENRLATEVAERAAATAEVIAKTATANAEQARVAATATRMAIIKQKTATARVTATARARATATRQAQLTAQAKQKPMVKAAKTINVRGGPGTVYGIVAKLKSGASAAIIGVHSNWWQIRLSNGKKGWVRKDLVKASGNVSNVPSVKAPPTPKPKASAPGMGALASNRRDFSGQQGVKGWHYQMEKARGSGVFEDMPLFDGACWRTGTWEQPVRMCKGGEVHPGISTRVAYRWFSSVDRDVTVKVHAHKIDTSCGDGIKVETYKITEGYAPGLIGRFVIGGADNVGKTETYHMHLTKWESVFVVIDIGDAGNVACDQSRVYIDIY